MTMLTPERRAIVGNIATLAKMKSDISTEAFGELTQKRRDVGEADLWNKSVVFLSMDDQLREYLNSLPPDDLEFIDTLVDLGAEGVLDGEVMLKNRLKKKGKLAMGLAEISALHEYLQKGLEKKLLLLS